MKIQIASDLHLEFVDKIDKTKIINNKNNADILALLGDIVLCGNDNDFKKYEELLTYVSIVYKLVLIITGNHEYYINNNDILTMSDINQKIRTLVKKFNNVVFLNGTCYEIRTKTNKYVLYGGTLWSNIPNLHKNHIKSSMNDYKHIYVRIIVNGKRTHRLLEPDDVIKLHKCYVKNLTNTINSYKNQKNVKFIVFTHHKPYVEEKKILKDLDFAYQTDLNYLIKDPIIVWCYGHTHIKDNILINNVKIHSNPKGYPYQKTYYENDYVIEI